MFYIYAIFIIITKSQNPTIFSKRVEWQGFANNTHDTFQLLFIPNWGRRLMRLSAWHHLRVMNPPTLTSPTILRSCPTPHMHNMRLAHSIAYKRSRSAWMNIGYLHKWTLTWSTRSRELYSRSQKVERVFENNKRLLWSHQLEACWTCWSTRAMKVMNSCTRGSERFDYSFRLQIFSLANILNVISIKWAITEPASVFIQFSWILFRNHKSERTPKRIEAAVTYTTWIRKWNWLKS